MTEVYWFVINLPSQCAICKAWPATPICHACVSAFGQPQRRCAQCAVALPTSFWKAAHTGPRHASPPCSSCLQNPPALDACWAATSYAWPWTQLVAQFKFQNDPAWARALALLMQSSPGVEDALDHADLILPMPLSAQRLAERGFNQALLLANALNRHKTQALTLLKLRHTAQQSSLKRSERLHNLAGALAVSPLRATSLRGQHVLLVDDVMTSGASLNTAAQVLKQAGALSVKGLVFARTEL
ncbi:MAG: ComF family protein [Betaproteobacteria bacterium]|nr:ComF family protein [Betaproteobacteria bacterium]